MTDRRRYQLTISEGEHRATWELSRELLTDASMEQVLDVLDHRFTNGIIAPIVTDKL